jgi:hypothetical protein
MNYKILLPVLISGVLFNACSKSDSKVDAPGDTILETYYPGTTMEIKELAIYTKDGVVTDGATIQSFIDRNVSIDARSSFYVGKTAVEVSVPAQPLHFLNDNRVNYNGINMQITGYKDSLILISEYTASPFPSYTTTCGLLLGKVPEYTAFSDCPAGNCASYRRTNALIRSGANYYAPMLTYAVVTKECAITATEIPAVNIVNTELKSMLGAEDSVLIQYAKLPLVKKATTTN